MVDALRFDDGKGSTPNDFKDREEVDQREAADADGVDQLCNIMSDHLR